MARILTYPERVSHHNIEKLRQCVSNGPDKYPGARMLTHTDGSMRQGCKDDSCDYFLKRKIFLVMMWDLLLDAAGPCFLVLGGNLLMR